VAFFFKKKSNNTCTQKTVLDREMAVAMIRGFFQGGKAKPPKPPELETSWPFHAPIIRSTCPNQEKGCCAVIALPNGGNGELETCFCVECFHSYPLIMFPERLLSGRYSLRQSELQKIRFQYSEIHSLVKQQKLSWQGIASRLADWDKVYGLLLKNFAQEQGLESQCTHARIPAGQGIVHYSQSRYQDGFLANSACPTQKGLGLKLLFMQVILERDQGTLLYITSDFPEDVKDLKTWCDQSWPNYFLKQGGLSLLLESDEAAHDTSLFSIINARFENLFKEAHKAKKDMDKIHASYAKQMLQIPELSSSLRLESASQALETLLTAGLYEKADKRANKSEILEMICKSARVDLVSNVLHNVRTVADTDRPWPVNTITTAVIASIENAPVVAMSVTDTMQVSLKNPSYQQWKVMKIAGVCLCLAFSRDEKTNTIQVEPVMHETVRFHQDLELVIKIQFSEKGSKSYVDMEAVFSCDRVRAGVQQPLGIINDSAKQFNIIVSLNASFRGAGARGMRSPSERVANMKQVITLLKQVDSQCVYHWKKSDPKCRLPWEIAEEEGLPADVVDMLYPSDPVGVFKSELAR
jgi:hypothetical protein